MIRVGIIGLGWWGRTIAGLLSQNARIQVVAGADPFDNTAATFCSEHAIGFDTFEHIIVRDDIDAVLLTSPHRAHEQQIVLAAQHGKHVFCEKPLALTADSAARAIAACVEANVRLGIGHERRFEPPMMSIREALSGGELGQLLHIEGNFSHDKFLALDANNWRLSSFDATCGPMTATGIHLLDMAVSLGGGATEVYATNRMLATRFASGDTNANHVSLVNGATANITAILATPFYSRFTVFGSKGWIEIRDNSHVENPTGWSITHSFAGEEPLTQKIPAATPVITNIERFVDAIEGSQDDYPVPLQEMLNTIAAFEAVCQSAERGIPVKVQNVELQQLAIASLQR